MTQIRMAEKKVKRSWWPLIGFLLIVSIAIISYAIAPDVQAFMRRLLPRLNLTTLAPETQRLFFAALTFLILILLVGLIVAMFAPRKKSLVKDDEVTKDRKVMLVYHEREKKRQRKVNLEIRKELKDTDPRTGKVE